MEWFKNDLKVYIREHISGYYHRYLYVTMYCFYDFVIMKLVPSLLFISLFFWIFWKESFIWLHILPLLLITNIYQAYVPDLYYSTISFEFYFSVSFLCLLSLYSSYIGLYLAFVCTLSSFAHLRSSSPWIATYQVHLLFRPLFPLFPSLIPIRRSFRLYGISLHFLGLFLVLSFLYFSSTCILQCSLKPLLLSAIRQYPLLSPRSESTVHLRIGVFASSMSFCELKRMD